MKRVPRWRIIRMQILVLARSIRAGIVMGMRMHQRDTRWGDKHTFGWTIEIEFAAPDKFEIEA